jgi:peptidoglycan/xylan/chitin deacetylase (PgdA/CDA1 family)
MRDTSYLFLSSLLICILLSHKAIAYAKPNRPIQNLEYFSYCSNGICRLITGEFFHKARGMPVDLHVNCKKNNQYALTFDDGPSKHYPLLLEILKRNNVKATFFIVGSNLNNAEAREWFRQAVTENHFMANHTFNHDDLTTLDEEKIVVTIEKTRNAMIKAIYPNPDNGQQDLTKKRLIASSKMVRPPSGNIDMFVDKVLKAHGYTSVRWNADRYDWNMPGNDAKTTEILLNRVRQQLDFIADAKVNGFVFNQSFLDLNHDWQPTTVDAIQDLISLVKSRGYEFVTLDECLGMK